MNNVTELKGYDDFQLLCGLTGKVIHNGDYVVWFPYFITDQEDPFWRYNEWPMLREAFDKWEHKEAFLMRWYESLLTHIGPRVRILVNQSGYLAWLVESPPTIVLNFLAHGFKLSIRRERWKTFVVFLLKAPHSHGEFHLPDNWRVSIRADGDKICVAWEPSPTFTEGRRDRILLNQSEWEVLKNAILEIDRLLQVNSS